MQRTPWLNILIVLLVIIAGLYLAQLFWLLLSEFADIILLFVLAWLVSFALGPLIEVINGKPLPPEMVRLAGRFLGKRMERRFDRFRSTRLHAVALIYLSLALILIGGVAILVPPVVQQLTQLVALVQSFAKSPPDFIGVAQNAVTRLGLHIDVESALAGALGSLQTVATTALQNALVILGGVLSLVANLLLVLLFSFFFALDGPRLFRAVFDLVPEEYDVEVRMLTITVDRTFGGFIRAQLLQAFLVGMGTAIVTGLFGQPFVLVASLFAGFFMLIPFVGSFLALLPPLLTTLFHNPDQLPLVMLILLLYQLVIVNVVIPKIMSEALGLHPLIILGSLLVGTKFGGFWGAFFAVPVAGVVATMLLFFYRRWARQQRKTATDASAAGVAPPLADTSSAGVSLPTAGTSPPVSSVPPRPKADLEKKRAS